MTELNATVIKEASSRKEPAGQALGYRPAPWKPACRGNGPIFLGRPTKRVEGSRPWCVPRNRCALQEFDGMPAPPPSPLCLAFGCGARLRCSMMERVSVSPVGIGLGAPPAPSHRRRCGSTFASLTPRASGALGEATSSAAYAPLRACRGRWASVCLARRLIRGLRADMRTEE